jgi:hypothetical protein
MSEERWLRKMDLQTERARIKRRGTNSDHQFLVSKALIYQMLEKSWYNF